MVLAVVTQSDPYIEWLVAHDTEVAASWVRRCVQQQEYLIALWDGQPVGFLRFSLFWGKIPFMDMVRVQTACQRQGVGTALYAHWEAQMRKNTATMLMTSGQADEPESLAWHKRNGFVDAGALRFAPLQDAAEIFLIKVLR